MEGGDRSHDHRKETKDQWDLPAQNQDREQDANTGKEPDDEGGEGEEEIWKDEG